MLISHVLSASLEIAVMRLPLHSREGLLNYFRFGLRPGDFLLALLENDFREAYMRADDVNQKELIAYLHVLVWSAPALAWGNKHLVSNWIERGAAMRQMTTK